MPITRTSGQGRPKGALNKDNRDIREMIVTALSDVGGAKYLAEQAHKNPVAFLGLVGRVLPLQVAGDKDRPLVVDFRWAESQPPATIVSQVIEAVVTEAVAEPGEIPQVVWQDDSSGQS